MLWSQNIVGLDIGTSSVKLMELKKLKEGFQLISFGVGPLPEGSLVEGEVVNHLAIVDVIKELISTVKIKSKKVSTSVSGPSVIIKRVPIKAIKKKDVEDQIFWEAEQYIPFDLEEVYLDYEIVSKDVAGETSEVIITAAKKNFVDSYRNLIKDAGLTPAIIDVDAFAIANVFETNYVTRPKESVVLIDMGASSIKIAVVSDGTPLFTRDIQMGGNYITTEIQKRLQLDWKEAEFLKVSGDSEGGIPQEVAEIISLSVESLVGEIRRSLDFFIASATDNLISYALLTGGSSKLPGMTKSLEETIGVPVEILNPFSSVNFDPEIFPPNYLQEISTIAGVVTGLAMRSLTE